MEQDKNEAPRNAQKWEYIMQINTWDAESQGTQWRT